MQKIKGQVPGDLEKKKKKIGLNWVNTSQKKGDEVCIRDRGWERGETERYGRKKCVEMLGGRTPHPHDDTLVWYLLSSSPLTQSQWQLWRNYLTVVYPLSISSPPQKGGGEKSRGVLGGLGLSSNWPPQGALILVWPRWAVWSDYKRSERDENSFFLQYSHLFSFVIHTSFPLTPSFRRGKEIPHFILLSFLSEGK